jgi:hypothetical protein
MAKFVGTWNFDTTNNAPDSVKTLAFDVKDPLTGDVWGTAVSTGWTPTLHVRAPGGSTLLATVTGAWEDATEARALFTLGAASTLVPAVGAAPIDYEALLVLTKSGVSAMIAADGEAEPYAFRVKRWP